MGPCLCEFVGIVFNRRRVMSGGCLSVEFGQGNHHDPLQFFPSFTSPNLQGSTSCSLHKLPLSCLGQDVAWDGTWSYISSSIQLQDRTCPQNRPANLFPCVGTTRAKVFCSQSSSATIAKFKRSPSSESVGSFERDLCRMPPQPTEYCVGVA